MINLRIRESELDVLMRVSGKSKAFILQSLIDTANTIIEQYGSRIKESSMYKISGYNGEKPYSNVRVHKLSKVKLRYSMFRQGDNIECMVKQIRSRYPNKPYTEQEIADMFYTECIEQELMNNKE